MNDDLLDSDRTTPRPSESASPSVAAAPRIPLPLAAAPPLRPVGEGERLPLPDVLRGVALLGIFMVNMPLFAMPMLPGFGGPELADAPLDERIGWLVIAVFFQYKFISLFSLLFGAGFMMQLQRAAARGRAVAGPYLRRLAVLLLIGAVHAFGIWYGDILMAYAVLGVPLLLLGKLRPGTLIIAGICVLLASMVLQGGLGALQGAMMGDLPADWADSRLPDPDAPALRGWEAMMDAQFNPADPVWLAAETAAFRDGPFLDALLFRSILWAFAFSAGLVSWFWHVFALFLIGAGMMKGGLFAPQAIAAQRRLALLVVPGLAIEFGVNWKMFSSGWALDPVSGALMGAHGVGAAMTMLGYLGLIAMAVHARPHARLVRFLAAPGRMALTVYLSESVAATFLMYWWGLGMFGSLGRPALIGIVLSIWLALAIGANLWLRAFRMGPMEWLWRSLTYLRPQPLLREPARASTDPT